MLKKRIIPILTFNGFQLVKTKKFSNPRTIGNPIQSARVFNSRNVDELVFIDIYATEQKRKVNLNLVKKIIDECYMPITIGGGISSFEDISNLLKIGADKVLIKSKAIEDISFINQAVNYFGSQCISIALDVIKNDQDQYDIFYPGIKPDLFDFINQINSIEVGEFVVNSVNNDGMMNGFDIPMIQTISKEVNTPLIVAGGAGKPLHFKELYKSKYDDAVAAASIFYFTQFTPKEIKLALKEINVPVRVEKLI